MVPLEELEKGILLQISGFTLPCHRQRYATHTP